MKFCFSRTIRTAESEGYQVMLGEDNIASLSIHYGKVTYAEYFLQEEVEEDILNYLMYEVEQDIILSYEGIEKVYHEISIGRFEAEYETKFDR